LTYSFPCVLDDLGPFDDLGFDDDSEFLWEHQRPSRDRAEQISRGYPVERQSLSLKAERLRRVMGLLNEKIRNGHTGDPTITELDRYRADNSWLS
jgi:hypothetical protein